MVVAIGENESNNEVEKTPIASSLSEDKSKKYRITVEPLGFLVLTASIIQVRYNMCCQVQKISINFSSSSRSLRRIYFSTKSAPLISILTLPCAILVVILAAKISS